MESNDRIIDEVFKVVPIKSKSKREISSKFLDMESEFKWQKESIQGKTRRHYKYRVFSWQNPKMLEIETKGRTLLEKISKAHSVDNIPTHVLIVECLFIKSYKMNQDSTFGQLESQSEYQKIILYKLNKEQIEKIVQKISMSVSSKNKKSSSN